MKISLNWLKQYLRLDLDVNKISEYLTDIGARRLKEYMNLRK